MNLSTPIEQIPRIGPAYQKKLKKLGIKNIGDIIFHFPHRYEDFSRLIPIAKAELGGPFCFQGEIVDIKNIRTFRKRMMLTQATLADKTGKLKALWFNQPYLINTFKKGTFVCLAGKITGKGKSIYLSNPAYEKIENCKLKIENSDLTHTGRLIPVYPETEGLSSKWLRFIVKPLLAKLKNQIPDSLPEKISKKYDFLPLSKAIWQIHFPDSLKLAQEAKKRFAFEELFNLSLFVLRERMKLAKEKAAAIPLNLAAVQEFTKRLPFKLTDAQKKCAWQLLKDLEKPRPMNRLLEGDVGSGKTVVAAMAALNVAKAGYQVAFMAPTEILAKQHYKTISELLNPPPLLKEGEEKNQQNRKWWGVNIGLITGKENYYRDKKITRKELLEKLSRCDGTSPEAGKEIDILLGTHALIEERVKFEKLALVVVDEQHRFGVKQRAKLCQQKNFIPHLLSMTATPIPRTLSLTLYGDLDLSVIDEMPKGRKKIITKIIQPKNKKATYEFIKEQVKEGRQVFAICPRIEPPKVSQENLWGGELSFQTLSWFDVKAVKQEYKKLSEEIFPDLKVGMLHGKMKSQEKEDIMKNFKAGKIDILVSTSVVEVGVDVPNASVMLIEGSEKFGLAQLHQFRGRVGRSDFQSYCFLFTDTPGIVYNRRLRALITCENGFELAEKDLAIRGPGNLIGQRQWGIPDLAMSSLADAILVSNARNEAKKILGEDPGFKNYPLLKKRLEAFREKIHLE
ncbi:MAG: DNA helicase RecG [Candidatus Nealsonbacteria bacterium CG08_land_8_20_14_0_20_38_20]|uniref:ATP-dependent DNA helicase RecG n=1 Tax=Candidatus Nealsonbacteria bacterium CG08_land_8_20_14_0_20_38_20 TaxID=1974705 RepID=A0A2H0YMZ1_9BACT|nr:MAG: DNA helicase RecG [Candidatus Nealsonbacteria bacterium CG08_land_8_20_14_0_20_38_20]